MAPDIITPFYRGSTFSFMMAIPDELPNGFFKNWVVSSQLRKEMNTQPNGLIASIDAFWADPGTTRYIIVHHTLTDKWPTCRAELDILFKSSSGERIRSTTALFNIKRGITE